MLGDDRVVVGVAGGFGASIVAPGHVHHHGLELVRLGERRGPVTPRIEAVAEVWRGAGFTVTTFDDVQRLVWEKLVCNVAFSGTCTVLGPDDRRGASTTRDAWSRRRRAAPRRRTRWRGRSGVELGFDDPVAYVRAFGEKIPGARPSMLLDLHGRAARREIDFINGAIPRVGRERRRRDAVERDGHGARQGARAAVDSPVTEIDDVLAGLLDETGASRVTLRQDLPGRLRVPGHARGARPRSRAR